MSMAITDYEQKSGCPPLEKEKEILKCLKCSKNKKGEN